MPIITSISFLSYHHYVRQTQAQACVFGRERPLGSLAYHLIGLGWSY
jgi:hypothetical protein